MLEMFEAGRLSDLLEAQRAEFAAIPDPLDAEHFAGLPIDARPLPEIASGLTMRLVPVVPPLSCSMPTLRRAADLLEEAMKLLAIYPPHHADIIAYKATAEAHARGLRRIADRIEGRTTEAQRRPGLGEG